MQADLAHLLAKAGHVLGGDGQRGLGRHIAARRAGAAGGQHQIAAGVVDQVDQRFGNRGLVIRNQSLHALPRRRQCVAKPVAQRRNPFILIRAGRGAV